MRILLYNRIAFTEEILEDEKNEKYKKIFDED